MSLFSISHVASCMYVFKKGLDLHVRTVWVLAGCVWLHSTIWFPCPVTQGGWFLYVTSKLYCLMMIFWNDIFLFFKLSFSTEIAQVNLLKPVNELQVQMGLIGPLWHCNFSPLSLQKTVDSNYGLRSHKFKVSLKLRHLLSIVELLLKLLNQREVMSTAGN